MTPERLAEIEALLDAADQGEWYIESMPSAHSVGEIYARRRFGSPPLVCLIDTDPIAAVEANARLIASAPTVIRELLAEIHRLRGR